MRIALIPLDERPVNTRYPCQIAAIAGVEVVMPPRGILSQQRTPADRAALLDWLRDQQVDRRIISIETAAYGGLIPSRITDETPGAITAWLDALESLPPVPTTAFNVITRIPDADDAIEEPLYWADHGRALHRYSALMHRVGAGRAAREDLAEARDALPPEIIRDFTERRLRNHLVNLDLLYRAARGALDLLVISSDDTSEYGFGSQEKAWLRLWGDRLGLGDDRLLMYPGADEVGCVLLMREVLSAGAPPRFAVQYAIEADRARIAPYEDSPIAVTVERQIRAIGGRLVESAEEADFLVMVNTPSRIGQEYDADHAHFAVEHARRAPFIASFATAIGAALDAGKRVIVCDVAYPNGSDPDLVAPLLTHDLTRLAAYGAWNTAGNTIGVALAQGVASALAANADAQAAQQRFLLHRFIEDWGYQHLVRQQTRDALEQQTGRRDITPENEATTIASIGAALTNLLPQLGGLARGWQISGVTLPWHRTFEVDFELEPLS